MLKDGMLGGHIKDLALRASKNDYLTHSVFLSESELATVYEELGRDGIEPYNGTLLGAGYLSYGGYDDADRRILVFLPGYMDRDSFIESERNGSGVISLLHVYPRNARFSEPLSHRDYLGSLMQLGLERSSIGDILVDNRREEEPASKDEAYIYVLSDRAELISRELCRVKHSTVDCELVALSECRIAKRFRELSGSVASERLDAVIAMVFHLARGKAQGLIASERVMLDGRVAKGSGLLLKQGQKVSVRGFGKFIYMGSGGVSKKGRAYASVRLYS